MKDEFVTIEHLYSNDLPNFVYFQENATQYRLKTKNGNTEYFATFEDKNVTKDQCEAALKILLRNAKVKQTYGR